MVVVVFVGVAVAAVCLSVSGCKLCANLCKITRHKCVLCFVIVYMELCKKLKRQKAEQPRKHK